MAIYRTAIDKLEDYTEKYKVESDKDEAIKLGLITACDLLRVNEHTEYVYVLAGHYSNTGMSYIQSVYGSEQDALDNLYEIAEIKKKYSENYNEINIDVKNNQVYTEENNLETRYMIHRVRIL